MSIFCKQEEKLMNWNTVGLMLAIVLAGWWLASGLENALRRVATAITRLAVAIEKENL